MSVAATRTQSLIERLPAVRGRLTEQAPLAGVTWFRVGGPAEVAFRPADRDDLAGFLAAKPADVPVTVIGVASNLLVRDGGVPGVVLRLGRSFAGVEIEGEEVTAGAGALDVNVAQAAARAGLGGLEFLVGVPGTIGGALRMNAGAYGRELKDVLLWAEALDPNGRLHRLEPEAMGLGYRHCEVPDDWIFAAARLRGTPDEPEAIARRMGEIQQARAESQPIRSRTGGSTFRNPPGERAWQLIDRAGCRGLRKGGAQVSEKHCNFLINTGTATAADLEGLGEEVRRRVRQETGIELAWEIKRIGVAAGQGGDP
ncbi:MAG: UDP-N-acetylmuramate dehydrogenase [Tistlia sp.]|uniref:UDP-N-acetylmuramate dehydrogenase n=1 Tax=Tistlia sp. TaxID=3057121 RepID=UPI0034A2C9C7